MKLYVPQLARTRPQLSFLYPPSQNRCYARNTTKYGSETKTTVIENDSKLRKVLVESDKIDVSSPAAVQEMEDMMKTLKAFAEDNSKTTLPEPRKMEYGPNHRGAHRWYPPESPIFHFLENRKRRRRLRERKTQAPGPNELAYDPWAIMLADPIRLCPASGLRLPKSLLTRWGLVRDPGEDRDVYFLPTELADMEPLESMGERAQKQPQEARAMELDKQSQSDEVDDDNDRPEHHLFPGPEADSTSERAHPPIKERNRGELASPNQTKRPAQDTHGPSTLPEVQDQTISTPAVLRMLPHLNLLKQVTLNVTGLDSQSGELQAKPNLVSRLLPTQFKLRLAEFNHYLAQRRKVEKRTGITSSKPLPQGNELEISRLQWQGDVAGRVLRLMRRRVVVAVKRILELEADKLKRRRVQVMSEGYLRSEKEAAPLTTSSAVEGQIAKDPATISSAPKLTGQAKSQADQIERVKLLNEIQTRTFLHFGPYPSDFLDSTITTSVATPLSPAAATAYLPPMFPSQNTAQMFPYFPLLPLLGSELHDELRAVVLEQVRDKQILTQGTLDPEADPVQPFALMIKVTAWHANSVIREVWRLWRYVGGREALDYWAAGVDMDSDAVVGDPRTAELQEVMATAAAEEADSEPMEADESIMPRHAVRIKQKPRRQPATRI